MNVSQVYSNKGTFQTYHSKIKGSNGQLLLLEISISFSQRRLTILVSSHAFWSSVAYLRVSCALGRNR